MNMYDILDIDLENVQDSDFIKFLRIEVPVRNGFGTVRFGRVRYALNGDQHEQENGLPIDLGKGIFLATLEDDELGDITCQELEKTLQKATTEIVQTVRKELDPPAILKSILKNYAYLKYDKRDSDPPNVLRCDVIALEIPRQVEDIIEIARRLSVATSKNYQVGSYSSSSFNDKDDSDEMWTQFSLVNFDFFKAKSKEP